MNIRPRFYPSSVRVSAMTGALLAFALLFAVHPHANGAPTLPVPAGATPAPQASATIAAPASAPAFALTTSESDELAALQARIPVLRAKKEVAELEAAIDKAKHPVSAGMPPALSGPLPGLGSPVPGALSTGIRMPSVSDISLSGTGSYDGRTMATLVVSGVERDVRIGDTLDDGWKVARIEGNRVQLARGGRVRWVRF